LELWKFKMLWSVRKQVLLNKVKDNLHKATIDRSIKYNRIHYYITIKKVCSKYIQVQVQVTYSKLTMNDYYSQFPQPSADVRARNIVDVMLREEKFRDYFTPDELKNIALKVVKVSKEYSQTGYNMFGYAEERQRMISTLESKMRQRPYEECF
jgi:hypothetical protein